MGSGVMVTGNRNVLVVDDEQPMREMMSNILADMDCEVFLAEGAADALAQVKQQDFAVIFLDLKLFGMNGIDLCRAIRKLKPLTILYAMTGWADLFEIEECREAGFDDFFSKPIKVEILIQAVEEAFKKQQRWTRKFALI
ncbi:MAG TPA: response regulator [Syntrophales bacterium]|nr:response regulator [Syntrophales bacterium]HON22196.1 response regulator [Syntrophales bacterium]HOU77037.1 response regulator [Syntrophales bacterium]HQG35202.1 response regulator [Syntrophales bacterium]HQI36678.1 response regulator [Syntrophales bacterium]